MSFYVSQPMATAPETYLSETQQHIYETLQQLGISFERVDTDDGSTMDDCVFISEGLNCPVVKTIFVCNRQHTRFHLFVTTAEKPFITKDFCGALGISRVSFAPQEMLLDKLGTPMGATTLLSLINDKENTITAVIDKDVAEHDMFACTDGTKTCFMKMKMSDVFEKFLPFTKHEPVIITV